MRSFDIVNNVICQTGVERNGEGKVTDPKPQGSPRQNVAKRGPTRTKLTINEEKVFKVAAPAASAHGLHQRHRPGPGHLPHVVMVQDSITWTGARVSGVE
jgi:hypothetical protein